MEPESFTETFVTIYQYTWRHIPEECTHRQHRSVQRNSRNPILIRYRCAPKHYLKFSVFPKIIGYFCITILSHIVMMRLERLVFSAFTFGRLPA
jgi:hypothetical protein